MTDLLELLAEQNRDLDALSLFDAPIRGVQERVAAFRAWCEQYDHLGANRRSHAWLIGWEYGRYHDQLAPRCTPTSLHADLGCEHQDSRSRCQCVGGRAHRGACFGCTWEGPLAVDEHAAVAEAHDHAWPGWRDLPTVDRQPDIGTSKKEVAALAAWEARVNAVYPPGWVTGGGPIRTLRQRFGTRDVPDRTIYGGYDLAVIAPEDPS